MKLECSNRQKLFYCGINLETGNKITKVQGIGVDAVGYVDGRYFPLCDGLDRVDYTKYDHVYTEHDIIPCGQCVACRLKQSMDYSNRGVLEMDYHETCYFLTLTYNDENLFYPDIVDMETGEMFKSEIHPSLCVEHLQLFKKRLRARQDKPIMILDCGEYGSKTLRPHYHLICWDLQIDDLVELNPRDKRRKFRVKYYTSPKLEKCWGKGHILIGVANQATIAYVCRYNLKKQKNDLEPFYNRTGCVKEFRHFPKKPALGERYFTDHYEDIYKNDEIIHSGLKYKTIRPPRYFDRKLAELNPELFADVKERRRFRADSSTADNFESMSYSDIKHFHDYHEQLEESLLVAIKDLKGKDI